VKHLVNQLVLTSGFALLVGTGVYVHAQQPRSNDRTNDRVPQYSNDTQQLGYEHGYRDGADRGRQDRDRGVARGLAPNEYQSAARYSYNPSFGNRRDYMSGYRDGFTSGYDDGYNYYERNGRYGQIYNRQGQNRARTNEQPFDSGYRQGIAAGQQDVQGNRRSDYRQSPAYRNGDTNFQDGFNRGYQDGYGRSRYQQDGGGYFPNTGNTGPADTRDASGQSRTITVPSTQQWTATGIRVNQGDRLQFQSSGEINLRPAANNDRAGTAGSLTGRTAPNSPIPSALAGALIGRIDSGQPWGLGNQTSVVMPASGMLYLGINDDLLTDNSGAFTVRISW
jgi:hypothetical protein